MTAEIANGIDLVEISRFRSLREGIKHRFIARVFTPREIEECAGRDASLAGLFAAKEAAVKALGCGIGEVTWQEMEILADGLGKPTLHLHGNAAKRSQDLSWKSWSVSITHTREYAAAIVTALRDSE